MIMILIILACAILALDIRALEWLQEISRMMEASKTAEEEEECSEQ